LLLLIHAIMLSMFFYELVVEAMRPCSKTVVIDGLAFRSRLGRLRE
jgi:hypothetical protein